MKRFNSILVPPEEQEKIDTEHPLCYFKTRNHFLQNIMGQLKLKSNLNAPDLQRNVHVQYLTRAYDKMKQKMVLVQKEKKRYLNPNNFQTILDTKASQQQQYISRQKMRLESQRNQLYNRFIQNYVEEPEPQDQPQIEILPNIIEPKISNGDQRLILLRQRQMQLLDQEINALRDQLSFENNKKKERKINPTHNCTNMNLLQKISGSIISTYMVHFDQVYSLFIDEILTQQVQYLNSIEDQWKSHDVNKKQKKQGSKKPKQHKLIELVRTLDQLCDV